MNQLIQREITPGRICIWSLDEPGSQANVITRRFLETMDDELAFLEAAKDIRGLVIHSKKNRIFLAGADLKALARATPDDMAHFIDLGQQAFSRLARLPFPKVSAIHGASLGGGLELALATDWRIGSKARLTKVGLPEVTLGLLPAWGGCTRLPRLLGFPKAAKIILGGKAYNYRKAHSLGLLDETVLPGHLLQAAKRRIALGRRKPRFHFLNIPPLPFLMARGIQKKLLTHTRGNYPAPTAALRTIRKSLMLPKAGSFRNEKKAFLDLSVTPAHENLLRLHFLREKAGRQHSISTRKQPPRVRNIVVLGAGIMGSGIAQWLSSRGFRIVLKEVFPDVLAQGMASIRKSYQVAVRKKVLTPAQARQGLDRITPMTSGISMRNVDLVIEAIVEDLETKKKVLGKLEARADKRTLFATNTSALSITAISRAFRHPQRLLGLHFFNPVHRMPLLEIIRGQHTSRQSVARAFAFASRIAKTPVLVRDRPGFLVNRILIPSMIEALHLFNGGESVAEIDSLMLRFGMPMGPLRLIDEVGTDVAGHVARDLANNLPNFNTLPGILARMAKEGLLGRKSGKGFYDYETHPENPRPNPDLVNLGWVSQPRVPWHEMRDRMIFCMVNEAARCLEEHVASSSTDIDLAMVLGTGWAPFRGGPLRYAESLGIPAAIATLRDLSRTAGAHFQPSPILETFTWQNRTSYSIPKPKSNPQPNKQHVHAN
ncbi:MAG: 3-hydroxyacyl-CoA dehydrogenase NAD-binding domain-containing protein [Opitutales bacterium]|nr:3-hydroxyacyl-CoA dehydrogenase NAD-binding domain-containing protein [Opitutales bacterium]